MGFNAPEWFIADIGSIMAGGIAAGIYTTNSAESCKYILSHSKAQFIVVENRIMLDKILQVILHEFSNCSLSIAKQNTDLISALKINILIL